MVETTHRAEVPAEWLEALAESEAQLAAGQTVPGDEIMRELHESIARLEANRADKPRRGATPRR
jgi:predicted metalloprotease with PDZ domain